MDGDLGLYDVIDIRLQAADTVVFLDFSPLRCAWRATAGRGSVLTSGAGCSPIATEPSAAHAGNRRAYR